MYTTMLSDSIVEVIFLVLGLIITRYLIPFLKEKYTAERVLNVYTEIQKAVQAAEKKYQESGMGTLKKQFVIDYINSKGFKITEADLDVAIESAVKLLDIIDKEIKE